MSSLTKFQKRIGALVAVAALAILVVALATLPNATTKGEPKPSPTPATTQASPNEDGSSQEPSPKPATKESSSEQQVNQAPANESSNEQPTTTEANTQQSESSPTPAVSKSVGKQMEEAIPRVEPHHISADAQYEPNVVLVTTQEGTTAEQLSAELAQKDVQAVNPSSVSPIADDVFKVSVRIESTIDDAIVELEQKGVVQGAQPNYVYHTLDDQSNKVAGPQPAVEPAATDQSEPAPSTPANQNKHDDQQATSEEQVPTTPKEPTTPSQPSDSDNANASVNDVSDTNQTSEYQTDETQNPNEDELKSENPTPAAQESDSKNPVESQSLATTAAANPVNDTKYSEQWALASIDAVGAWESPALSNAASTTVAVLDECFYPTHEDLVDNIVATFNAVTKAEGNVSLPSGAIKRDHGNHVAGIVAATSNNGIGISGVGNNHLKLALIRLLKDDEIDDGDMYLDDIVSGYDYLIANKNKYNIRVANMSLGYTDDNGDINSNDALLKKVDQAYAAGIVTTAAAGNATSDATVPFAYYPGDAKNIVSVINLANNGSNAKDVYRSSSSNYNVPGQTSKNISAPGTTILSTSYDNLYVNKSGTSMAAPHVAGLLGLLFAANPNLTASQAVSKLYNTARDIGSSGWDEQYGYGEINAANALASLVSLAGPEYLVAGKNGAWSVISGSNANPLQGFSFSSSAPEVVSVNSSDGTGKANTCGVATITATKDNTSCSREVTVLGPLTVNPFVPIDGSVQATIATPNGANAIAWTWNTSNKNIASITDDGIIRGHSAGTARITASLVADPNVEFAVDVTVYESRQSSIYLPVGSDATLTADESTIPHPEDNNGTEVAWESVEPTIATVDQQGKVHGVSAGITTVKRTVSHTDGSSTTCVWPVSVYGPIEGNSEIMVGETTTMSIPNWESLPNELKGSFAWSSSDNNKATVDANGVVTGVAEGPVTIYATVTEGQTQIAQFSKEVTVLPFVLKEASEPTVAQKLVYNASEQQGVAAGTGYVLEGTYKAKDAGTYAGTAKLKFGYKWADGSEEPKTIEWTIAPATLTATYRASINVGERHSPNVSVSGFVGSENESSVADYVAPVVQLPTNLSKPGRYTITPSGGSAKNYAFTCVAGYLDVFGKAKIPVPAAGLTYNGRQQVGVASGTGFTLTGTYSATNAGTYKATAKLQDHYRWSDGTVSNKTVTWSIAKQSVAIPSARRGLVYNRTTQVGVWSGSFYNLGGTYRALNAGSYVAHATLKDTINYRWTDGTTYAKALSWSIAGIPLSSCSISTIGTQAYTGKAVCPKPTVSWGGQALNEGSDYTLAYSNNVRAGTATVVVTGRGNYYWSRSLTFRIVAPTVSYRTHVQNVGWQRYVSDGRMSGTSGRGLRLEGINIRLGSMPASGGIQYRTHVQNIGWQGWRSDGRMSGTSGRGLRLEAIEIRLTGQMAKLYDVYYRVHAQNVGWMGWAKNGARSGTAGFGWRLEGIQVVLVPKGQPAPGNTYLGIRRSNWRPFLRR
ncbi:MAG: S8 family serine peptidase [Atopobiaceae bacterium]|nr:S8 family serine peptidase [Atopobiaceae bacterium]